jgi:hypothetical protein
MKVEKNKIPRADLYMEGKSTNWKTKRKVMKLGERRNEWNRARPERQIENI